ncbi:MAG: DUF1592 domain-containing protein [Deltaproteobacteria bacterium]|nr:DUF1592 domain-containing protein [Deltaproteobacteria bacterium]
MGSLVVGPAGMLSLVVSLAGCSGTIAGDTANGGVPEQPSAGGANGQACAVLPQRIYRLTPVQLQNTFAALLGPAAPDKKLIQDLQTNLPRTQPFSNGEQVLSNNLGVTESLMGAVEAAAAAAIANPERLAACMSKGINRSCVGEMLDGFGLRAWRRPFTKEERDIYLGFFDSVSKAANPQQALTFVVQRLLMAPDVLFRLEIGQKRGATFALSSYEIASALSYGLTDGPPDAELLQAAANNKLASAEDVRKAAQRILKSATLAQGVQAFFEDFVDQGKPAANADYAEQARRFLDQVLWQDGGKLSTLLSANYTFLNAPLAKLTNANVSVPEGMWMKYTPKADADTAGLLSLGLVMGRHTNQSARGRFVSERLLCTPVPDPPNNVSADLDATKKALEAMVGRSVTTEEARAQHVNRPDCAFCHKILDPLGQPFAAYDRLGVWRDKDPETSKPFATSATVDLPTLSGEVANARALGLKLAESQAVRSCFAGQVFEYLQGRKQSETDECHVAALAATRAAVDGDVLGLFAETVASEAFRFRAAPRDQ